MERFNTWLYCQLACTVRTPGSDNSYKCTGILTCVALIDEAIQKFDPRSLQTRLLHVYPLPTASWTPRSTKHVRHHSTRVILATHCKRCTRIVMDCSSCSRNGVDSIPMQHLKLFLAVCLLQFIAMNILGMLSKKTSGKQYSVIMTDRNLKVARSVPTSKTSAQLIVIGFYDNWIVP